VPVFKFFIHMWNLKQILN